MVIAFVLITLAFTALEYKNVSCEGIEIIYNTDDNIKVHSDDLKNLVLAADENLLGKRFDQIDADSLEKALRKHDAVLNAEVYKVVTAADTSSFTGILAVKVKHREPVLRVISSAGNYYLDELGGKIPVSSNYAANVLVATGTFSEEYAREELLPCVLFIENDEFWEAQIEQVHVEKDGDLVLTPLVGDHIIELGNIENYKIKLRNMKAFYKQVLADDNWNKYKSISLKYRDQVIAKRR